MPADSETHDYYLIMATPPGHGQEDPAKTLCQYPQGWHYRHPPAGG